MPLLHADWLDVVFIHFRVDPGRLQPLVPLNLDLRDGSAFVSLVAFTQRRLRLEAKGKFLRVLTAPLADHAFLNLRTYVERGNARGIFFLAEWIPNRLACLLGPLMYGLPYRFGALEYRFLNEQMFGRIESKTGGLTIKARWGNEPCRPADADTLDHFLVERYLAFTHRGKVTRRFDVAHDAWPIHAANVDLRHDGLLGEFGMAKGRWENAQLICAHHSPGVRGVGISRAIRLSRGLRDGYFEKNPLMA